MPVLRGRADTLGAQYLSNFHIAFVVFRRLATRQCRRTHCFKEATTTWGRQSVSHNVLVTLVLACKARVVEELQISKAFYEIL